MAIYTPNQTGNFSNSAIWDTVANTPTINSSNSINVTTAGVTTLGYTAPNTSNAVTGVWVYCTTPPASGRNWTATLVESGVEVGTPATMLQTNMPTNTWVYFRLATPYVYTTVVASSYQWRIKSTTANSGTVFSDTAGTALMYMSTDDRHTVPSAADQIYFGSPNCTGVITVTVDGTTALTGGTGTAGTQRAINLGMYIGGALVDDAVTLEWDRTANASLQVTGDIAHFTGGTIKLGDVGNPQPAGKVATLTVRSTSGTAARIVQVGSPKFFMQGNPLTYYNTNLVSGTGTAASPLVTSDSVDWTVGDRILVTATSNSATNYNENEYRFIITKNSSTSYVLSATSGGVEAAFTFTHSTNAKVLNVTRNVVLQSANTNILGFSIATTIAGYTEIKWANLKNMGTTAGTPSIITQAALYGLVHNAGTEANIDYNVFDLIVSYGLISLVTTPKTYTGNIFIGSTNGSGAGCAGLGVAGVNSTFVDHFIVDCNRQGIEYRGVNCTFTNPTIIGCNKIGNAAQGGFYLANGGPAVVTGANIHANRVAGVVAATSFNTNLTNSDVGNKGINPVDVFVVTNSANNILFTNCNLGGTLTASNYLNGAVGATLIRFDRFNQTANRHQWYTEYGSAQSTGAGLPDTTVRTAGTLNVRIAPESLLGFKWEYKILASPGKAVSALGFIERNAAFAASDCLVELFLPGSTVADASQLMATSIGSYLVYNIAAVYTGMESLYATVRLTAKTATASAYIYTADVFNGTNNITNLNTWNEGQPSSIMFEQLGDPQAVWAVATSTLTTAGTVGQTVAGNIPLIPALL